MELAKHYAVVAPCVRLCRVFPRPLGARSSADDSMQDIKHPVCQLIDTVSQGLAISQSAALLFPQGAQMLVLLSPPSPYIFFCPDNICTAVLSAATHRRGMPQPALELLTARGRSAQMAGGGVRGLASGGGGGWQVETVAPIWPQCWHSAPGHLQRLVDRNPVRSWKSPCTKHCTLWAVLWELKMAWGG